MNLKYCLSHSKNLVNVSCHDDDDGDADDGEIFKQKGQVIIIV